VFDCVYFPNGNPSEKGRVSNGKSMEGKFIGTRMVPKERLKIIKMIKSMVFRSIGTRMVKKK